MEHYAWLKLLHVLSSTILFGTGIGSAFFMLLASLARDAATAARVTGWVVIADTLFTATTAVLQPATGFYMLHLLRLPWSTHWVATSIWLYALAIGCWLPVVWIQIRMRDTARDAAAGGAPLPGRYFAMLRAWIALGAIAFCAFVGIFAMMVLKPS
jgi:uncharacterized membrane protein